MPKSVPKSIQTCFRVIFSKKILCPVFHEGSSFRKLSINFFSKLQKCPKSFPKVSKHVLNMFWGKLFENFFPQCSVEGRVFKNFQIFFFKIPKMPKIVPQSIQTCFERVLGQTFRKFFAQFSTAGRFLENFQKNQKKIQNSKNAQNRSQKYPKVF